MTTRIDQYGPRVAVKSRLDLARRIDDTRLVFKPGEDPEEVIRTLCDQAILEQFRAVCIRPEHVKLAKGLLSGSPVMVATVIAFPKTKVPLLDQRRNPTFGDVPWEQKLEEMRQAKVDGADEFDIVMNTAFFRSASHQTTVSPEEFELAELAKNAMGTPIKLIIETDLLTDEEIAEATNMCIDAGIEYVKTSTGMLDGGQGATEHNISLIYRTIEKSTASKKPGIKASGGVRSASQAFGLIQAGADIIGSSSGTDLLNDFEAKNHIEFNR